MIDPVANGQPSKRPYADLPRPRGRAALSTHPPTPVDDTTRGSLEQWAKNTGAPAALQTADPRNTATWDWSKPETERRRHAAATQPTLAPIDAFPDVYSTADDLAPVRRNADPDRLMDDWADYLNRPRRPTTWDPPLAEDKTECS